MNSLFRLLTIVIVGIGFENGLAQTTRDVSFTVATDETSLNRLVANNYSLTKFPKVYNGTYNGAALKVEFIKRPVCAIQSDVKMEFRLRANYKMASAPFNFTTDSVLIIVPFVNMSSMIVDSSDNDSIWVKVNVNVDRIALNQIVTSLSLPSQIKDGIFALTDSLSRTKYTILSKAFRKPDFKRSSPYNDYKIVSVPELNTTINGKIFSTIKIPFQSINPTYDLLILTMGPRFAFQVQLYSNTKFSVLRMKTLIPGYSVFETNTYAESVPYSDGGYLLEIYDSGFDFNAADVLQKLTITIIRDGVESDIVWDAQQTFYNAYYEHPIFIE